MHFVRVYHPKKSIKPQRDAIARILTSGWCAQPKADGHQAQVHIDEEDVVAWTRHGSKHTVPLPAEIKVELRRLFPVGTVVLGEWLKGEQRLCVFDLVAFAGEKLDREGFEARHERVRSIFTRFMGMQHVTFLDRTNDPETAWMWLQNEAFEGIVLRSCNTPGFADTSIVRCRRAGMDFHHRNFRRA